MQPRGRAAKTDLFFERYRMTGLPYAKIFDSPLRSGFWQKEIVVSFPDNLIKRQPERAGTGRVHRNVSALKILDVNKVDAGIKKGPQQVLLSWECWRRVVHLIEHEQSTGKSTFPTHNSQVPMEGGSALLN